MTTKEPTTSRPAARRAMPKHTAKAKGSKSGTAGSYVLLPITGGSGTQAVTERTFRDIRTFRGYLRGAELNERVKLERQGVPSLVVKDFISRSGVTARTIQEAAGIPKATFTKKLRGKTLIGGTAAHSLMGMFDLVNAIEDMVRRDPAAGAESFNAEEWVGEWIQKPIPALGGQRPADLWDTPAGREAVLRVVGAAREGVFL
jgi:Uncharacterized conserved protein